NLPMRRTTLPCLLLLCLTAACGGGESFDGYLGRWQDPESQRRLTLNQDQTASGNDGCNTFGGEWAPAEDAEGITFQATGGSTQIACPEVPESFADWDRALLVGETLEIHLEDGRRLVTLTRLSQP